LVPIKHQPLAGGRVSVHGENGNAGGDGGVDIRAHQFRVRGRDEDSAGLGFNHALKFCLLGFGIVRVRPHKLGPNLHLRCRLYEACARRLPIRHPNVGRDQHVFLVGVMARSATHQQQQGKIKQDAMKPIDLLVHTKPRQVFLRAPMERCATSDMQFRVVICNFPLPISNFPSSFSTHTVISNFPLSFPISHCHFERSGSIRKCGCSCEVEKPAFPLAQKMFWMN
jgi:hypothetical protein